MTPRSAQLTAYLAGALFLLSASANALVAEEPAPTAQLTPDERQALEAEAKSLWVEAQRLDKEGKLIEALQVGEKMLAAKRKVLGDSHRDIVFDLEWLADRYENLKRLDEAKLHRAEAVRIVESDVKTYSALVAQFRESQNHLGISFAAEFLGKDLERLKRFNEAAEYFQISADAYDALKEPVKAAWQYDWKGSCFESAGNDESAVTAYSEAVRRFQELKHDEGLSLNASYVGKALKRLKRFAEAAKHFQISAEAHLRRDSLVAAAWMLRWKGDCYLDASDDDAAAREYSEALRRFQELKHDEGISINAECLGIALKRLRRFDDAERAFQLSADTYDLRKEHILAAWKYDWIGDCFRDAGNDEAALKAYSEAVRRFQELKFDPGLAQNTYHLGKALKRQKRFEDAARYFQISADAYLTQSAWEDAAISQDLHGSCLLDLSNDVKAVAAIKKVRQEILAGLTQRNGSKDWRVTDAQLTLGDVELSSRWTALQRQQLREAEEALSQAGELQRQGLYREAIPFGERVVRIREDCFGKDHHQTASALFSLAVSHYMSGDTPSAEPLHQRAREIRKSRLGTNHPDFAESLNSLAIHYDDRGDYGRAERLYREAMEIRATTVGEQDSGYARNMGQLAFCYQKMGDYQSAERFFVRAASIQKAIKGPRHSAYATEIYNLAVLFLMVGNLDRAEELARESLSIREQEHGPDHPDCALSLSVLGGALRSSGEFAEAEQLYLRASKIWKTTLGTQHSNYAVSLSALADIRCVQRDYAGAESSYREVLEIYRKSVGERHPSYASAVNNLGLLYRAMNDFERAEPQLRQALEISLENLELAAEAQSERQQLAMSQSVLYRLHSYLSLAAVDPHLHEQAYRQLMAWKGAVLARQRAAGILRDNPELRPKYLQLEQVTAQFARLAFVTPEPEQQAAWRQKTTELFDQKERLERELADKSSSYRKARQGVVLEDVRAALPDDAVLVDLIESWAVVEEKHSHPRPGSKGEGAKVEPHVLAFIIHKSGPTELVVLANPVDVEQHVDAWRAEFGRSKESREAADWLRAHVWGPLEEKMGAAKTVLISPDGALGRLPFAALRGKQPGTFLVEEDRWIAMLPSAAAVVTVSRTMVAEKNLLVLGGVNYDRALPVSVPAGAALAPRKFGRAPREDAAASFDPLPATEGELATIKLKYEAQKFDPLALTTMQAGAATEEAFRRAAPQHKYLHLATHGFFASEKYKSALARTTNARDREGHVSLITEQSISGYHPNLLSGIVLAGANDPPEEGDDGILTAEEVQTLDLRRTELVVLSACETGLGKTAGGEGLLGLQRSFQVAGAKTVIASLWKVDDVATRDLMERFYENLWSKTKADGQPYSKLEALREAQLWMLKERGPRGATPVEADLAAAGEKRLPPYYWAAFVLSGDWR